MKGRREREGRKIKKRKGKREEEERKKMENINTK